MSRTPLIAGIELGGTKVACILAGGPDEIRAEVRIDTTTPEATLDAVTAQLKAWRDSLGFEAIGVASFGPLDVDPASATYGCVVNTSKAGWSGANLLERMRPFEVPTGFDTDVTAAALAEGRWGAARDLSSFAYVTVGTGVGVGCIVDGRPVRGLGHPEVGHLRVGRLKGAEGFAGVCPYHGDCVEGLASGPAIQARAGKSADTLSGTDPAWDETVHALAGLCHNLVLTVLPRRILIGGGVGMGQAHLLPRVRRALLESLNGYGVTPKIAAGIETFVAHPGLGDRAGPLGAVALGLDALAAIGPGR